MATRIQLREQSERPSKRAEDVDRFIGVRIGHRRRMLGLSQQNLADLIGTTYQQAHKYERGLNRVPAARLHRIAKALGVGVDYFYEGYGDASAQAAPTQYQRMLFELARDFLAIADRRQQEAICQLARALAGQDAARRPDARMADVGCRAFR